jgi:8-oxo-dGTP diphosphatase
LQKFSTPVWVAAVALLDQSGQVLLQRRRLGAVHGGLWEFPGGKVEPGESPETAALRELEEELGVMLDPQALLPLSFASGPVADSHSRQALVILLYSCRSWHGVPHCREGEEIRWFAPDAVSELEMPPLDYPLARALRSSLRRKP